MNINAHCAASKIYIFASYSVNLFKIKLKELWNKSFKQNMKQNNSAKNFKTSQLRYMHIYNTAFYGRQI